MGCGRAVLVIALGAIVAAPSCSPSHAQACRADQYPLRSVVLDSRMVPGFDQYEQQDGPIDLTDDDDTGARTRLFTRLGINPGDNVVSEMGQGDGAPNHGVSLTSAAIQAPSATAARQLVNDGAVLVAGATTGFFRAARVTVVRTEVQTDHAVALTYRTVNHYEADALMWTQGSRAFLMSVAAPAPTHPERRARTLAEQQQLLSTCA